MPNDEAFGERLAWPHLVMVRLNDTPAGVGMTPSGLWVEHTERLPAIFGEIVAVGAAAAAAGFRIGMFVLFVRYSGEETASYEDGQVFSIFSMNDILSEVKQEALIYSSEAAARFNLAPDYAGGGQL